MSEIDVAEPLQSGAGLERRQVGADLVQGGLDPGLAGLGRVELVELGHRRLQRGRVGTGLKTWELSLIDHASLDNWDGYTEAAVAMFAATHTLVAPWAVVNSNDKRTARLNAIRHVLHALPTTARTRRSLSRPPGHRRAARPAEPRGHVQPGPVGTGPA